MKGDNHNPHMRIIKQTKGSVRSSFQKTPSSILYPFPSPPVPLNSLYEKAFMVTFSLLDA